MCCPEKIKRPETSPQRSSVFPDLPTIAEAGLPGYEVTVWGGVVVANRVPKAVVDKLNAEMNAAITDPAIREALAARGYDTVPLSVPQFTDFIRKENAKWMDVVKRAGIKADS